MRTTRLLAALATAALVAGCGGEGPKPSTLPSKSASPSPSTSASPTPTPPALPAAVRQRSQKGAEAAVLYFVEALNFSGQAGDTSTLRSIFGPPCTRCDSLADAIDKTYASGGYYRGGNWTSPRLKFYSIRDGIAYVDATVDYEAQEWVKAKAAKPVTFAASKHHLHAFQLAWSSGGWRIGALDPDS